MLEGVVILTHPLLKSSFIDHGKPIRQKVHFLDNNGINGSTANPGQAPILRTKSITKKEMNKCIAEIYDPGGIRTRAARLINQYHNHWAKENSS